MLPLDSTSAPASSVHSPVPGSRTAVQVSPAPVVPMPDEDKVQRTIQISRRIKSQCCSGHSSVAQSVIRNKQ
jgi:hypothetical protein